MVETKQADAGTAEALRDVIAHRYSDRGRYDIDRRLTETELRAILEAARWAPTPHNMQNFEIVVVDDPAMLEAIGRISVRTSLTFIRESYAQLSFTEAELQRKGTGILAASFPVAWLTPDPGPEAVAGTATLADTMRSCPLVLLVLYDRRRRAPASDGDVLGLLGLGCVMQNMWLTADTIGLAMQIMSVFSNEDVQSQLRPLLGIPPHLDIAFACRLGHPLDAGPPRLRVRRPVTRFAHRNR
jgi:nitroreductase